MRALGALALFALLAPTAHAAGQLVLESEPTGAQVLLDGEAIGQTPLVRAEVPDGVHQVILRKPGHQEGRVTVRVVRDLTTRKTLRLSALGAEGELRVTSVPSGARVLLDGRAVGTTPLHLSRVAPGHHTLSLRRAGYRERKQTVRVVADLTTTRDLRLAAQPRPIDRKPPPIRPPRPEAARPAIARPKPVAGPKPPTRPSAARLAPAPVPRPHATPVLRAIVPTPLPEPTLVPPPIAPRQEVPWRPVAFYGLMGMFLATLAGLLWQRRAAPADWQEEKPLARFQPLTPGRLPIAAVEGCLRGIRLLQAGQAALGAEVMLGAYREAPSARMIYNVALAWHLSGSPLAEVAYRTAIGLDPAHRDARYNLARYLSDAGRPYEALLTYRELVALAPEDGPAWFNLGTLAARLGMGAEAILALRRASRLMGGDTACRHNLRLARQLHPWWRWRPGRDARPLIASSA